MASLAHQVAIVLGGSGGIGAATARRFAEAGARVIVGYRRDAAGAASLVASLAGAGHAAHAVTIEDTSTLVALRDTIKVSHGRDDILVNSAGFTKPVPHANLDALDDALIDQLFAVNWRGQFAAIRTFRALLETHGDGLVVNVSSIAGINGAGSNIAYGAAKAGIDVMTRSLARALAPKIRVMGVSPGVVATDFVPGRDASANAKIAPTIPLQRVAEADDVAAAILACATHLTYSTGSTLIVDGGRLL